MAYSQCKTVKRKAGRNRTESPWGCHQGWKRWTVMDNKNPGMCCNLTQKVIIASPRIEGHWWNTEPKLQHMIFSLKPYVYIVASFSGRWCNYFSVKLQHLPGVQQLFHFLDPDGGTCFLIFIYLEEVETAIVKTNKTADVCLEVEGGGGGQRQRRERRWCHRSQGRGKSGSSLRVMWWVNSSQPTLDPWKLTTPFSASPFEGHFFR